MKSMFRHLEVVFELKYFFSSELATDTGKMISSKVIMKMINELIKKEDKKRPLSDNEIAKYFSSQGNICC